MKINYDGGSGIPGKLKVVIPVIVVLLLLFFFMVRSVKPDAGFEAVLVHKPLIFGHGGVDPLPVKTGRSYVWFTTLPIYVNMQPIQFNEHFEDLMSSDGVPLDFDNRVRQAVRKHGMNETAIDTKAIDAIDAEVSAAMTKCVEDAKLPLKMMDVTVGKANPPDSIKSQRVETAAQQQRVLTEHQRKLAEDARKQAETSRAASDNAYRLAMGMAPDQFIQLENIKMMKEVCKSGNCTFIVSPSGVSPIIDIRRDAAKK